MKKTSKYALALLIAGLGFFNLKSSATATNQNRISLTENFASADDEGDEEGEAKYKERETTHTTGTTTVTREGKPNCTQEWESDDVNCVGAGTVKCKTSHDQTIISSDCDD